MTTKEEKLSEMGVGVDISDAEAKAIMAIAGIIFVAIVLVKAFAKYL